MNERNRSFSMGWRCLPLWMACLLPLSLGAQDHLSAGLWVGHAVLGQVNEVVSAVNANNVRVQTPPQTTTPTSDQAEIQLILHVDAGGQVRLLKSVAVVDSDADPVSVNEALLTDPALFSNYTVAQRIASAAFEFGDPDSRVVVGDLATAAAVAAAASPTNLTQAYEDALEAAEDAVAAAAAASYSPSLEVFVGSSAFTGSPATAAAAARETVEEKYAEGLRNMALENAVRSGVLIGLQTVSQMADGVSLNEVAMSGDLEAGGVLGASVFLGAYHPTNPFRHRRNPSHRGGYDITRNITLEVASPEGGNDFDTTDRGVDRLTGVYKEEVFGLHKPLGQSGEFGLRTMGTFVLDRISRDATLND